jgi:hypothetical protein
VKELECKNVNGIKLVHVGSTVCRCAGLHGKLYNNEMFAEELSDYQRLKKDFALFSQVYVTNLRRDVIISRLLVIKCP